MRTSVCLEPVGSYNGPVHRAGSPPGLLRMAMGSPSATALVQLGLLAGLDEDYARCVLAASTRRTT